MNKGLEKAIIILKTAAKIARICHVSEAAVCRWRTRDSLPPRHVITIEKATQGKVKRWELRPDIYPPEDYK